MATLNGKPVDFAGFSLAQIGERLREDSHNGDGCGIRLELTEDEQNGLESIVGMHVGGSLRELIEDASKAVGKHVALAFNYDIMARTFTTS